MHDTLYRVLIWAPPPAASTTLSPAKAALPARDNNVGDRYGPAPARQKVPYVPCEASSKDDPQAYR